MLQSITRCDNLSPMNKINRHTTKILTAAAVLTVAVIANTNGAGSEEPSSVAWTGNGWNGTTCDSFEDDNPVTPGPGERVWHFVLNQYVDPTGNIFFGGDEPGVAPTSKNKGVVHFHVVTSVDADPTGTYVEAAGGKLVLSHCEDGEPEGGTTSTTSTTAPSTTTTETTTTTEPSVTVPQQEKPSLVKPLLSTPLPPVVIDTPPASAVPAEPPLTG